MTIEEAIKTLKVLIGLEEFNKLSYKENKSIETLLTAYEKEKEKNKELISQIDEHVYNGCDYELCNKKWVKKIKALMEKEDKLFFETKDVRHANRYKAYKELIKEE